MADACPTREDARGEIEQYADKNGGNEAKNRARWRVMYAEHDSLGHLSL